MYDSELAMIVHIVNTAQVNSAYSELGPGKRYKGCTGVVHMKTPQ